MDRTLFYLPGKHLYAVFVRADGQWFNAAAGTVAAYDAGAWASYAVALAAAGGNAYVLTVPSTLPAGSWQGQYFERLGSFPATSDPFTFAAEDLSGWNGGGVAPPPVGGGGMTLATARDYLRRFARNGTDQTMYSDADLDATIQTVGDDFVRATRCTARVDAVTIAPGGRAVDLSGLGGFLPGYLMAAYAAGVARPLAVESWGRLHELQVSCGASGDPEMMAFEDMATAAVYPAWSSGGSLRLRWAQPFVTISLGTTSPADVTLNVPAEYMRTAIIYGGTAMLQHAEPEARFASDSWQRYEAFKLQIRGTAGSLATRVIERTGAGR